MDVLTFGKEVAGLASFSDLCLLLHPMVLPASLKLKVSFQGQDGGEFLLEVFVTTDLRILQLVQDFLGVLADGRHDIAHELALVCQDLLEDLFHVSLDSEQICLDASPVKDREAATVPQRGCLLFGPGVIHKEHLKVKFEFPNEILEDVISYSLGNCLVNIGLGDQGLV
jgi:hypothetical protein